MKRIEPFKVNPLLMFLQRSVVNPVMIPLLRWFGSSELMLLTYVGPKSGKRVTIPLGYRQEGEVITSFTPFGWWRALRGGREVTLSIRRHKVRGLAEPVTDLATVTEELTRYLEGNPGDARFFQVRIGPDHHPDPADVARPVRHVVMIRIHLQSPPDAVPTLQSQGGWSWPENMPLSGISMKTLGVFYGSSASSGDSVAAHSRGNHMVWWLHLS